MQRLIERLTLVSHRLDFLFALTVKRDQLARNLDAAWTLATAAAKDWWLVLCHEHRLKHREEHLIQRYRTGTWSAGLPHLPSAHS